MKKPLWQRPYEKRISGAVYAGSDFYIRVRIGKRTIQIDRRRGALEINWS